MLLPYAIFIFELTKLSVQVGACIAPNLTGSSKCSAWMAFDTICPHDVMLSSAAYFNRKETSYSWHLSCFNGHTDAHVVRLSPPAACALIFYSFWGLERGTSVGREITPLLSSLHGRGVAIIYFCPFKHREKGMYFALVQHVFVLCLWSAVIRAAVLTLQLTNSLDTKPGLLISWWVCMYMACACTLCVYVKKLSYDYC